MLVIISPPTTHLIFTALKPIDQLYKKTVKVFDRKPQSFHLCSILEKYQLLSFENLKVFKTSCLIYRSTNGMAPPPLGDFIKKRNSETTTRSTIRGDCEVPFRKTTFAQNVLSIGCLHMTSLLWREMQLEGRKWFFSIGISSRHSRCLCFALFMNAQIGQTEKTQDFIVYEHVLFIKGEKSRNWLKNAGKSSL